PTTEPPASSAPKPVAPSGWHQVWADEFAGSSVDPARWRIEDHSTYGDGNKELACLLNRPENLNVSGGVLHLVARRESTPVQCGSSDARFPGGRTYTSAHLTTKGKADWTYGRFEVRAKLPTAAGSTKGLWPAFWLRPTAGGTGELDVLEAIGSDGSGSEHTKVHQTIWYDYSGTHKQQPTTVTVPNGSPSAGYHVYATEWEPGEIRWYIDGVLTYTRTLATTPWLDSAFNKPFYLRLNLAIGGGWPGSPTSATEFPASYDVDYVRVYQR
ncbi:MAG: glycoside hydrolase family 16 protein, partial [Kineosporiaceae bacterium]